MSNSQTIVNTKYGKLEGYQEKGLYVFKGIPYATPPVGDLRWMPPEPPKPWSGVKPAKAFGAIAPQAVMAMPNMPQVPQEQSEDCLFLNIWTPGLDNTKRPVMVWIHGGAFTIGSGSDAMYDSDVLIRRGNIVLVSINYRLGLLGFLRLCDVTGGKIAATGNEGLLDQIAALKWIKENIAAFGGDPGNVTVFGESAGAMSIGCLMVMPDAKGLFQKGILESGVGNTAISLEFANDTAGRIMKVAGINEDNAKSLYKLTSQELLNLETKMRMPTADTSEAPKITATMPVIDGKIIPGITNKVSAKGGSKGIAAIIGTNLDEWTLFAMMDPTFGQLDEARAIKRITAFMSEAEAREVMAAYRQPREKRGAGTSPADIVTAIQTDQMFRIPALDLVTAQQSNNQKAYNYLFTWKSPVNGGVLGACHALEIGFVFGKYDAMFCGSGPAADKLAKQMQDAWLAFAHTGDPSCESVGKWPEYGKDRMTMIFDKDTHVEAAPYDAERRAWDKIKR